MHTAFQTLLHELQNLVPSEESRGALLRLTERAHRELEANHSLPNVHRLKASIIIERQIQALQDQTDAIESVHDVVVRQLKDLN